MTGGIKNWILLFSLVRLDCFSQSIYPKMALDEPESHRVSTDRNDFLLSGGHQEIRQVDSKSIDVLGTDRDQNRRKEVTEDLQEVIQVVLNHTEIPFIIGDHNGHFDITTKKQQELHWVVSKSSQSSIIKGLRPKNKLNISGDGFDPLRSSTNLTETESDELLLQKTFRRNKLQNQASLNVNKDPKRRSRYTNASDEEREQQRFLDDLEYVGFVYFYPAAIFTGTCCNIITVAVLAKGVIRSSSSVFMGSIAVVQIVLNICRLSTTVREINKHVTSDTAHAIYVYTFAYVLPAKKLLFLILSWLTVAFTMERYVAICHPLHAKSICTMRNAKRLVVLMSFISLILRSTDFFRRNVETMTIPKANATILMAVLTPLGKSDANSKFLQVSGLIASVSSVVILVIANCLNIQRIYLSTRRRELYTKSSSLAKPMGHTLTKQNNQIFRILLLQVATFLFCYSTETTINEMRSHLGSEAKRPFMWEIELMFCLSRLLAVCNPLFNFIIYIYCSPALRKAIQKLFAGCVQRKSNKPLKQIITSVNPSKLSRKVAQIG